MYGIESGRLGPGLVVVRGAGRYGGFMLWRGGELWWCGDGGVVGVGPSDNGGMGYILLA